MGAAWIAALAAVLVAFIGVVGNLVTSRRRHTDDEEVVALEADLNIIRALSNLLEQEQHRRIVLERRLAACEGREQAREHDAPH